MSSNLEWIIEEDATDFDELIGVPRESGDGESKETSPHISASEDDNQDCKQALIESNRRVDRKKDKKVSKIPVRQVKLSNHVDVDTSTYGNGCHFEQSDFSEKVEIFEELDNISNNRKSTVVENCIQTDVALAISKYDFSEKMFKLKLSETHDDVDSSLSDSIISNKLTDKPMMEENDKTNLGYSNTLEIDGNRFKTQEHTAADEIIKNCSGSTINSPDIPNTLKKFILNTTKSDNINFCENILEAPEEFRSLQKISKSFDSVDGTEIALLQYPNILQDETACRIVHGNVGEPSQCHLSAPDRDHDKANTPEASNVYKLELNKDIVIPNPEIKMDVSYFDTPNLKPWKICMTNEEEHGVIELARSSRKVNVNECAKVAAPSETIEIIHNVVDDEGVFTDIIGGALRDNDHIQSDSMDILKTKATANQNVNDTCSSDVYLINERRSGKIKPHRDNEEDSVDNSECSSFNKLGDIANSATVSCFNEMNPKLEGNVTSTGFKTNDCTVTLSNVYDPRPDNSCSFERDSVNGSSCLVSNIGAFACAENEQTLTTAKASIEIGVARCAQAPRCSRNSTTTVCTVPPSDSSNFSSVLLNLPQLNDSVTEKCKCETSTLQTLKNNCEILSDNANNQNPPAQFKSVHTDSDITRDNIFSENFCNSESHLVWQFKNGRLVFEKLNDENGKCKLEELEASSRPCEELQSHPEDTIVPELLQVIEKCAKKIESSVDKITKETDVEGNEVIDVLCSKDLNKRIVEGRSRLKHLENKLKEAGITDGKTKCLSDLNQSESESGKYKLTRDYSNDTQAIPCEISGNKENTKQVVDKLAETLVKANVNFDDNQNVIYSQAANQLKVTSREEEVKDLSGSKNKVQFAGGSCEFDVRQINSFSDFLNPDFYVVYDELEDCSDEDDCEHEHYHIISEMRGDGSMGTNGERTKNHNPDRENLKSLLKKPGRSRDVKKNRVVFNENKNEFFDADYIILIREECDYDDEEDDGVCTCNEHEMVRLTCCEPNCNCNIYDGYASDPTPQSPKFAPPLEFVDAVTLSPPEGYKDMELGEQEILALQQMARRGQRTAVCRDCSATHEDEGEGSQSDNEDNEEVQSDHEDSKEETQKTDQSQQTTPTTPPASDTDNDNQHQYIIETISAKEKRIMEELEDDKQLPSSPCLPVGGGSPISGILKGGRLWKQHNQELNNVRNIEQPATDSSVTSDEESNGNKRSVRFTESNENTRDSCDGEADKTMEESSKEDESFEEKQDNGCANSVSPESTEMMLTFKLGNHILISNNSLKPNSAVRQLFPCSKPLSNKPGENDSVHQYLVTAESLKAFEEAKRSKLPQIIQSDETDESIKRAIERNTLRRSLIRYEPRPKKKEQKTDNSLIERIKLLTCDVDDEARESQDISHRTSPPGEEARKSPEFNQLTVKNNDKSFSPSSSSTGSSNSSSVSSTYKKITDLFAKREKLPDIQNNTIIDSFQKPPGMAPDLGNTASSQPNFGAHQCSASKVNTANDSRKQFLAPLTACVSGTAGDEHYYHITHHIGDRASVTSSVGTEYSLEDIDEGLKKEDEDPKRNAPDVVVGTPSASESGDELAMFVQQDAGRIERIKKKYQQDNNEDDEHDDYGFNKRPNVRGIKPRFGTTNEILQQIQNQMQPPLTNQKINPQVNWPYYSEASLSNLDNNKSRNPNQNLPQYKYTYVAEEMKAKMYVHQYRPPGFIDDNIYQNCANQQCNRDINYKANVNHVHSPVMRIGGACTEAYHQAIASKSRNGRPESPPPFDVAKNIHQTMVYIPYNHIEPYQPSCASPNPQYASNDKCYARVVNQNQINNRYIEPVYLNQPRMNHPHPVEEVHYQLNPIKQIPKPAMRLPYPLPNSSTQSHLISSRSESPLPGQFSTARSTQTSAPVMSTCNNYYPRYRPVIGPIAVAHSGIPYHENVYSTKINRHSFPTAALRYPAPDSISLTDSESQYSVQVPNGFRQCIETTFPVQKESAPNSPTKSRFIERGVPEGAASVSPQDSTAAQSTSTMTSPTSPQNPIQGTKPMYYAMNV